MSYLRNYLAGRCGKPNYTIFTPNPDRIAVEAASGGRNTVMLDDLGQPSIMVRVDQFNLQDIDPVYGNGVHPMFIVNGVTKSEIWIGKYLAAVSNGRAVSLPGRDPANSVNFDTAKGYCSAKGAGWHMMTNAEWAGIAIQARKINLMPRGNTYYGRSDAIPAECGVRQDYGRPGNTSGNARTLTGSGPISWSHDGTQWGIRDLCGCVWEWVLGLRLNVGEIQIIENNNAVTADHSAGSAAWKAVLQDGSLVAPGTAGTLKYDSVTAGTTGVVGGAQLDDVIDNSNNPGSGDDGYTQTTFDALAADAGITAPPILKALCLFPGASALGGDRLYVRNYGERLPCRGGTWYYGGHAGVFALILNYPRSNSNTYFGFRPAFVSGI